MSTPIISGMSSSSSSSGNNGRPKLRGIRQIVKLKGMLQKWQSVTLGSKSKVNGEPSCNCNYVDHKMMVKKSSSAVEDESDDEVCSPKASTKVGPPADVPKGYLAVYVGCDLQRFIIPTAYLSHSTFKELLEKAEDEFGFDHCGALTIPCDIPTFKSLLTSMHINQHNKHISPSPPHAHQEPLMT